jgi:hypothetical protein
MPVPVHRVKGDRWLSSVHFAATALTADDPDGLSGIAGLGVELGMSGR